MLKPNNHCWHKIQSAVFGTQNYPFQVYASKITNIEVCCWCGLNRYQTRAPIKNSTHGSRIPINELEFETTFSDWVYSSLIESRPDLGITKECCRR